MISLAGEAAKRRLLRFLTVGVGAALLLFVLTYAFLSLGIEPVAASLVAYAIAFAVAYSAQRRWTFGGRHRHTHALPRYFAVQLICALASSLSAHVAAVNFTLAPLLVSAIVAIVASAASYFLALLWVFPDRAASE